MAEQVIRKIEVSGDTQGQAKPQQFGQSFDELLDGLEVKTVETQEQPEQPEAPKEEHEEPEESVRDGDEENQPAEEAEDEAVQPEETGVSDIEVPTFDEGDDQSEPSPEEKTRADDEDSKKELEELRNDPHTHTRVKKNIERLLGKIQNLNKQLREKDKAVEQATAKVQEVEAQPKADPVSEQEKTELSMLRRRYAIEKEGTLKEYDTKVKSAEETLMGVVKSVLSESDAKTIEKMGFEKFANQAPKAFREFLDVLDDDSPAQGALVRAKYAELISTKQEKERKQGELLAESDKWWKEQEEIYGQQQQRGELQQKEIQKVKADFYNDTISRDPYFKALPIDGLKGDALARAQTENAKRAIYQRDLQSVMNAKSIDDQKKVVYRAALARVLADQLNEANTELKRAKDKIAKVEAARNTRPARTDTPSTPRNEAPEDFATGLERLVRSRS